jgi:hypothetical protein
MDSNRIILHWWSSRSTIRITLPMCEIIVALVMHIEPGVYTGVMNANGKMGVRSGMRLELVEPKTK